jgi:lipoate-protein ligase A
MERWFLLDDDPAPAAWNMAMDEYLLGMHEGRHTEPILRLYSFSPPAVTVGYHQDPALALDLRSIERDSIDVARRFTGGRALLHDDELTYCLVAGTEAPPFDTHLQHAYMGISRALVLALRSLGVEAILSSGRHGSAERRLSRPCLDSVSRHEITVRGRKIVASAQRRTRSAMLQHGSIFLTSASGRIAAYMRGESHPLSDRLIGVAEERGAAIDPAALKKAIVEAFELSYGISFEPLRLTPDDREDVERRRLEKQDECSESVGREVSI